MRKPLRITAITLLAVLAFLPALGRRPIVTSHEARVAQTARQMAVAGWPWRHPRVSVPAVELAKTPDGKTFLDPQWPPLRPPISVNPWLIPVLNGEVRLQKTPLPYWCAAVLFRLAHAPGNEALARLTPAVLGLLATFLIYALARRLLGRTVAWCAALIWVSTHFAAEQYRLAMADPYLSFFTLLALWAWVEVSRRPDTKTAPPAPLPRHRFVYLLIFYLAVALGLLAKGPPLFLVLGVPIVLFHLCTGRRPPIDRLGHLLGAMIVAIAIVPWAMYVRHHVPHALEIWRYESIGELPGADNVEKARPFWFYIPSLFQLSLPWTPLWIAGLVMPFIRRRPPRKFPRRRRPRWFPFLWYITVILLFSAMPVKKNTYLLPVLPAQVLITAQALAALLVTMRRSFNKGAWLAWIQAAIGIGAAAAITVGIVKDVQLNRGFAIALAALALAAAAGAIAELRARTSALWLWRQSIAYVLTLAAFLSFWSPARDTPRSARPICAELLSLIEQTGEPLALTKLPEEASLYLPLTIASPPSSLSTGTVLVIVDDPHHTAKPDASALQDRVPGRHITAVERVPLNSAPGDARWKVFRLTVE